MLALMMRVSTWWAGLSQAKAPETCTWIIYRDAWRSWGPPWRKERWGITYVPAILIGTCNYNNSLQPIDKNKNGAPAIIYYCKILSLERNLSHKHACRSPARTPNKQLTIVSLQNAPKAFTSMLSAWYRIRRGKGPIHTLVSGRSRNSLVASTIWFMKSIPKDEL